MKTASFILCVLWSRDLGIRDLGFVVSLPFQVLSMKSADVEVLIFFSLCVAYHQYFV